MNEATVSGVNVVIIVRRNGIKLFSFVLSIELQKFQPKNNDFSGFSN